MRGPHPAKEQKQPLCFSPKAPRRVPKEKTRHRVVFPAQNSRQTAKVLKTARPPARNIGYIYFFQTQEQGSAQKRKRTFSKTACAGGSFSVKNSRKTAAAFLCRQTASLSPPKAPRASERKGTAERNFPIAKRKANRRAFPVDRCAFPFSCVHPMAAALSARFFSSHESLSRNSHVFAPRVFPGAEQTIPIAFLPKRRKKGGLIA